MSSLRICVRLKEFLYGLQKVYSLQEISILNSVSPVKPAYAKAVLCLLRKIKDVGVWEQLAVNAPNDRNACWWHINSYRHKIKHLSPPEDPCII